MESKKTKKMGTMIPIIGPAILISVGYIDPGNWATDIQGGSSFGYQLLWVLLLSNIMAILLQTNAAKLGIATGESLAENCKKNFNKKISFVLWITAEIAALATDIAEFLGASIGVKILTGVPLFWGAITVGIVTFIILNSDKKGERKIETIIFSLVAIVTLAYVVELVIAKPDWKEVGYHTFVPSLTKESLLVAIGIIGATVMPHNIFLHSEIVKKRLKNKTETEKKNLFRYVIIDSFFSLNIAWFINSAMVIVSAAIFFYHHLQINSLEVAYQTLNPLLGHFSSFIFGVALLASGLSSSVTGTMAGQSILEGFLNKRMPVIFSRIITMVPALIVIGVGMNVLQTLVISQVILSIQLPFTIIPLIILTSKKNIMGALQNKKITILTLSVIALLIILLNVDLMFGILN